MSISSELNSGTFSARVEFLQPWKTTENRSFLHTGRLWFAKRRLNRARKRAKERLVARQKWRKTMKAGQAEDQVRIDRWAHDHTSKSDAKYIVFFVRSM